MSADAGTGATIHATAVALGERGVLIRGAAGSGKSALALVLIGDPRGDAMLVADDRVALSPRGDSVVAAAPEGLRGLLEIRGIGIVRRLFRQETIVRLVIDLLPAAACPRLPEAADRVADLLGRPVPRLALPIGAADGATRVRAAMAEWVA